MQRIRGRMAWETRKSDFDAEARSHGEKRGERNWTRETVSRRIQGRQRENERGGSGGRWPSARSGWVSGGGVAAGGSAILCSRVMIAALLCLAGHAATRPQYGGTLRVEVRQSAETPDPPPLLGGGFGIARWKAGRLAVYEADENASGGRPYLAGVEILLGRALRDQAGDLDLGKADRSEEHTSELQSLTNLGRPPSSPLFPHTPLFRSMPGAPGHTLPASKSFWGARCAIRPAISTWAKPTSWKSAPTNCAASRPAVDCGRRRRCACWRWFSPRGSRMHACAKPWRWRWIAPPFTRCCCNGRAKSPAPCCRNGFPAMPSCFPGRPTWDAPVNSPPARGPSLWAGATPLRAPSPNTSRSTPAMPG